LNEHAIAIFWIPTAIVWITGKREVAHLTDGPKTNAYRALVDPRDWTCGFISRADVADFLVKQIDGDAFLH
jgi:hypothetical protein